MGRVIAGRGEGCSGAPLLSLPPADDPWLLPESR
jgi:hypothetical protein